MVDYTPRLKLPRLDLAGGEIANGYPQVQNDLANLVDANAGAKVCTSTTRPSSPFAGQIILESDTKLAYLWTGTDWVYIKGEDTNYSGSLAANIDIYANGNVNTNFFKFASINRERATGGFKGPVGVDRARFVAPESGLYFFEGILYLASLGGTTGSTVTLHVGEHTSAYSSWSSPLGMNHTQTIWRYTAGTDTPMPIMFKYWLPKGRVFSLHALRNSGTDQVYIHGNGSDSLGPRTWLSITRTSA